MVLPKLKRLELLQLPSLVCFGPLGYHFMFPRFNVTTVMENCPNMTMCFTVDVNNLMHARTQNDEKNNARLSKIHGDHFLNLEDVKLNNCGVEEVFQLKGLPLPTTSHDSIWSLGLSNPPCHAFRKAQMPL